ncbi:MAG TPA: AcrB/AcrD/AcrF family protein [Halieaceae bacterium]|uniref:efflux RND transporter permease subunit n=1 Tax=Haliea TaxID=475794 RepID=UPI000C57B761|nr:efflux RND transporter permease subunit [Haliea sp.]HBQ39470.1 AcrB/AcrD/AcrF family protein [Halieaceae bacterium]MAY93672.1 RND transporter [Haliea sp.]MBK41431.1 RND transporter [Haliea sp.]MBP68379.1 RND transporter [Haliea sp.]HCD54357.1 AcrB/AcrD/AcrF family protein [Halieaceae bacterium]
MRNFIGWWVHNPVAANLLMLGILLAGVLGFVSMEREAFPRFEVHQVEIEVTWPGAAPQEVEEQIVLRIEESLDDLDNVKRVSSTASEGLARLEVSTWPDVDLNQFLNDVKNRVDAVTALPRDIEPPRVKRSDFREEMIRIAVHGEVSERELTRLAEDLRDEVAALPWISLVELFGTRREEVTIELSQAAMLRYGVSFDEVANAIRGSSINLSSGQVRTVTGDVRLRARNLADSSEDFSRIVLRQNAAGATVTIGDVATVIDGYEENEILATLNGEPAVLIQMLATDNMQVVKASEAVKAWMQRTRPNLPAGISLTLWFDTADIYESRMELIGTSAWLGLLLVFLVLIMSLRPKVALWVTAGIAVAFVGTFAVLPANDVSLNVMSTFAFLLVLGIVVDDAIVVGESIHQHAHTGGGTEAAIDGALAVARPVIFAVLTTMIAFAPWFFVDIEGGNMTRQFSIVITAALTISLIEAFCVLPSHLRHLEHREHIGTWRKRQRQFEESIVAFANTRYRRLLTLATEKRYLTASLFTAAFIISLGVFTAGWVKFTFFPEVQNEQVHINVVMPSRAPYSRSLAVLARLQEAEKQLIAEVESRAAAEGGSGKLVQGWYTRSRRDSVIAIVSLSPPEERALSARETAERFRELVGDIPDAEEIEVSYTLNDQGAAITWVLRHRDLDVLRAASSDLQAQLRSYQGSYYVRDSLRAGSEEIHLSLRPGAEKLGVSLADVSRQVRQAYYGEEIQRLPREHGDVRVMLRYPSELREQLASLDSFRVRTGDGREVPLLTVVAVEVNNAVDRIQRQDGERMVRISAEAAPELVSDMNKDLTDNFLPVLQERYPQLVVLRGGEQETEQAFFDEIIALYAVALFAMYALIAVAFRSYALPLLIMTAIPFGFMGAIYGHLLFATPMALFSYFGIGAAAGVVVNDNLVLVDYIGRLRERGHTALDAVLEAGVARFRPILLTTVTTFVGLLPIMAERSTDAQFLKPAVLSLAFGVLFALLVTLLMVPALYLIGEDSKRLARRLWPWAAPAPARPAEYER